jgi:hypothetical protein
VSELGHKRPGMNFNRERERERERKEEGRPDMVEIIKIMADLYEEL